MGLLDPARAAEALIAAGQAFLSPPRAPAPEGYAAAPPEPAVSTDSPWDRAAAPPPHTARKAPSVPPPPPPGEASLASQSLSQGLSQGSQLEPRARSGRLSSGSSSAWSSPAGGGTPHGTPTAQEMRPSPGDATMPIVLDSD